MHASTSRGQGVLRPLPRPIRHSNQRLHVRYIYKLYRSSSDHAFDFLDFDFEFLCCLETGAKVHLECRDREDGNITYSVAGQTDKLGTYILTIDGEHEEELCETALVESSNSVSSEINKDAFIRRSARISLTTNNGITSPVRAVNPLGFVRKTPLPLCTEVLRELGMTSDDLIF